MSELGEFFVSELKEAFKRGFLGTGSVDAAWPVVETALQMYVEDMEAAESGEAEARKHLEVLVKWFAEKHERITDLPYPLSHVCTFCDSMPYHDKDCGLKAALAYLAE